MIHNNEYIKKKNYTDLSKIVEYTMSERLHNRFHPCFPGVKSLIDLRKTDDAVVPKLKWMPHVKGALYRIQILCRRYTFWSYPAGLTIAEPPG